LPRKKKLILTLSDGYNYH